MRRISIAKRGRWLLMAVMLALAAGVPAAVSAQAGTTQWRGAAMVGAQEVPPTTSTATGTFTATLDEAAGTLTWTLSVPNITNGTAAHLHQGPPTCACPIVLPLFSAGSGQTVTSMNASGTSRAADLTGALAGNFAGFVASLKSGQIYVNAHSTQNPGGEIRSVLTQAVTTQATATAAVTAAPKAAATASPSAPKTGNAGLTSQGTALGVVAVLAVLAAGVVAGGRLLGARSRIR